MGDERRVGLSIRELADLAATTVRTIHYYIAEGLLPSPHGSRRNASYSGAHLARLRLIAALRDEGLALSAIRARLAPLTDAQALSVVATLDEHLSAGDRAISTLGLIEAALTREVSLEGSDVDDVVLNHLTSEEAAMHPLNISEIARPSSLTSPVPTRAAASMAKGPIRFPGSQESDAASSPDDPPDSASDYVGRLLSRPPGKQPQGSRPLPLPRPKPDPYVSVRPETWHHFEIADGVELRIRDDRYRESRGQLRAIIDALRPMLMRYGLTQRHPDEDDL